LCVAALCAAAPSQAEPSELPPEVGYNYGELETARTAALGGALRAFSNSLEALQDNPANLAATRVYHMGALAQFWSGANRQSYGASIVDSVVSRSRLAGGVSGNWLFQDPDGVDRQSMDVRAGIGFPVSDKVLIGASGRYLDLREDGYPRGLSLVPPSAASSGLRRKSVVRDISFDAGITLRPAENLNVAVVGKNLTDPGHSLLPLQFGGGVGYGTSLFTVEADLVADFTTYEQTKLRGMGGVEFLAGSQYPVRLGYRYDDGQGNHALSGGLGYLSKEFSFDLAVRRVFGDNGATAFFFGLRYHVEALGIVGE
jgi:opacity protein-like surface antigen